MSATRIVVGRISGVYGVKGWVKVYSHTKPLENILHYTPWQLGQHGQWREVKLAEGKPHGKGIIARVEGCEDRDAAAQFIGSEIAVTREQLPPPKKGEYYWIDLVGAQVTNQQDILLGEITAWIETGANDVMVVKGTERERLIPFLIPQVILSVDVPAKQIRVDWDADIEF
jgi:16S rRNA processing protein RimM